MIPKLLGNSQASQGHAQAVAGRLVHLTVHQGHLAQNVGIFHLVVEVIAFAGALAHASEYGESAVLHGDVANQLHKGYRLAHAGTAEQADFSTPDDGHDQVNHLDAGFQNLVAAGLIFI